MSLFRGYFVMITLLILPAEWHAARAQEARLNFAAVPAARSGLDHALNSNPKLGTICIGSAQSGISSPLS